MKSMRFHRNARISPIRSQVMIASKTMVRVGSVHAVFASLATLDVYDHALLVEVAELQARQFGIPGAGSVKSHQHCS
jgi:hypothetical protein